MPRLLLNAGRTNGRILLFIRVLDFCPVIFKRSIMVIIGIFDPNI